MSHIKNVTSRERKNNIFGEREDVVIRKLLLCGCESGINVEDSPVNIIARGKHKLYFIHILSSEKTLNGTEPEKISDENKSNLLKAAPLVNATPIYGILNKIAKKVKFYNLETGKEVKSFE